MIATTGAALVLQQDERHVSATPEFVEPPGTGFPGTLVAFEIPTDAVQNYYELMTRILRKAEERTPKRASGRWLSFAAPPESCPCVELRPVREDTVAAAALALETLSPAITARQTVVLDFGNMELCTQSWLHALLFEPVRLAWAMRVPIHVRNVRPTVQEGLRFLEAYALGG